MDEECESANDLYSIVDMNYNFQYFLKKGSSLDKTENSIRLEVYIHLNYCYQNLLESNASKIIYTKKASILLSIKNEYM